MDRHLLSFHTPTNRDHFMFRTEEAVKYLEATKLQSSNQFTEEFAVMEGLMGLVFNTSTSLNTCSGIY